MSQIHTFPRKNQLFGKSSHIDFETIFNILLRAILGRLGANLDRLGRILASQNPPKIAQRGLQDASQDEVQHRFILEAFEDQNP